jgi:hypothetical protein
LVAEKVEIDPMFAGATFFQAEHAAVKVSRGRQVIDGNGEVKWGELHRMGLNLLNSG